MCVSSGHREYEEGLEKRFADLRDRLQYAEALNRQREDDLFTLRSQFNLFVNSLARNITAGCVILPNVLNLVCVLLLGWDG